MWQHILDLSKYIKDDSYLPWIGHDMTLSSCSIAAAIFGRSLLGVEKRT